MTKNQEPRSLSSVLVAALLAGVLAGLFVAAFHEIATEPVLQRAIDLETILKKASGQATGPELFSRSVQHAGLFIGYLLYGIGWGALFGVVACLFQLLTRTQLSLKRVLVLTLIGLWTVGILPQLKCPANPPGVGEPASINFREEVYLAILLLSVLGTLLAAIVYQALGKVSKGSWQRPGVRIPVVAGLYLLYIGILYIYLPNYSDPVLLPPDIIILFRSLSVVGVILFWLAFGTFFMLFLRQSLFSAK